MALAMLVPQTGIGLVVRAGTDWRFAARYPREVAVMLLQ